MTTYRNGYIMTKGKVIGYYANGYIYDENKKVIATYANGYVRKTDKVHP